MICFTPSFFPLLSTWSLCGISAWAWYRWRQHRQRPAGMLECGRALLAQTLLRPELRHHQRRTSPRDHAWPAYKFYGELFQELLELQRLHGAAVAHAWQELRECLGRDVALEELLAGHIRHAHWQLGLMALAVWIPMLMFLLGDGSAQLPVARAGLVAAVGLLQAGSSWWWWHWPERQRRRCLDFLGPIAKCLLSLQVLGTVRLDMNTMLRRCGVDGAFAQVAPSTHGQGPATWHAMQEQLLQCLQLWRNQGQSPQAEVALMISTLWTGHRQQLELFKRRLEAGQLLVMAVGFVGSYLIFVGALLHGLLRQLT